MKKLPVYILTHLGHSARKMLRVQTPGRMRRMMIAMILAFVFEFLCAFCGLLPDQSLSKFLFFLRGDLTPPKDIVIIAEDDESFIELGISPRHPFPRNIFAKAIQQIQSNKPKLLMLDVYAPVGVQDEEGTIAWAKALTLGPSVLSKVDVEGVNKTKDNENEKERISFNSDPRIVAAASMEIPFRVSSRGLIGFPQIADTIASIPKLEIDISDDERFPFLRPFRKFIDKSMKAPNVNDLINYYGPAGTIRRFSIWEFFSERGKIPPNFFKDKIVFVGYQSILRGRGNSDKEVLNVPIGAGEMYGVEIHANIAGNLLEQSWIRRLGPVWDSFFIKIASFFLFLGLLSFSPKYGFLYMIAYLSAWFGLSYVAFAHFRYFIPGYFLILAVSPLVFATVAYSHAMAALKELRETKKMMGLE